MAKNQKKNVHVLPHNGCWAVKREGQSRVFSIHVTQRDAIVAARKRARAEKEDLVIHARNGQVRERNYYNSDPLPPKTLRKVLFPSSISKVKGNEIRKAVRETIKEIEGTTKG